MKEHVTLQKIKGKLHVCLHFGGKKQILKHTPQSGILRLTRRGIAETLLRYVNQREQAYKHTGTLTLQRIHAIRVLRYRMENHKMWPIGKLGSALKASRTHLITLMPYPSSRNFNYYNQLVADLIDFANNYQQFRVRIHE